jgi:hypothetical protein
LWPGLNADARAQETVEQDGEHDQCEGHIQAIAFDSESGYGEGDARDWCGDQEEQSELDQTPASTTDDTLDNSGDGAVCGGLAAKDAIIGGFVRVPGKVDTTSTENDSRREQNSGAKQVPEDDFNAAISPRLRLEGLWSARGRLRSGHQIFPQKPL